MLWILLAIILAAAAFALHYGYKLSFYYEDPLDTPYDYVDDEQTRAVKPVFDAAIAEFEAADFETVTITSHDGLKLTGRYFPVAEGAPLEICCHGYKGNAIRDFCGAWRIAKALGHNLLLIDERCHRTSEGHTITFGIQERKDVCNWVNWATERFGPVPMLLSGVSMGAATVLMVSAMQLPDHVKAVIADCPYDAPANIIKKVLGQDQGMPVSLVYPLIRWGGMLYGRFNLEETSPLEAVKQTKLPILLIHGDDDRFVPYDMSVRLHAAAPETIRFHTIHGAGHALNYVTAPEEYTQVVMEFVKEVF